MAKISRSEQEVLRREFIEHQKIIGDLQAVLATKSGRGFFKYLLKTFDLQDLPKPGMDEDLKNEYLGFLRAGRTILQLVSQANPSVAGTILTEIEKEKYDELTNPPHVDDDESDDYGREE
jgi:hypothetical protein